MPNPVVHFEIGCINTKAQQDFYCALFEWSITPTSEEWDYGLVQTADGGITGGISQSGEEPASPMVTFYVEVDDIQACLDKAVSLGTAAILPPTPMEVGGASFSIAGFLDPEGNYIGLVHNA